MDGTTGVKMNLPKMARRIWWKLMPCVCYDQCVLLARLFISLCPASFCTPRPIFIRFSHVFLFHCSLYIFIAAFIHMNTLFYYLKKTFSIIYYESLCNKFFQVFIWKYHYCHIILKHIFLTFQRYFVVWGFHFFFLVKSVEFFFKVFLFDFDFQEYKIIILFTFN